VGFSCLSGLCAKAEPQSHGYERKLHSNTKENLMTRVHAFLSDESGVTAIEYALIASLIAVFIIVALQLVGTKVSTVFNEIGTTLK
jgi:pilus assembly protein Flp/PilA